jgi:hypothetical protein
MRGSSGLSAGTPMVIIVTPSAGSPPVLQALARKSVSEFGGGGIMPPFRRESLSQSDHEHGHQRHQDGNTEDRVERDLEEQSVGLLVLGVIHIRMAFGWIDMHSTPLVLFEALDLLGDTIKAVGRAIRGVTKPTGSAAAPLPP